MLKNKNKKFNNKNNTKIGVIFLSAVILSCGCFLFFSIFLSEKKPVESVDPNQEAKIEKPFCENFNLINNLCLENSEPSFYYGVMIENHGEARPQAGLSQADFVFETIAEAPITRFLAIFSSDKKIEKIGPIRSARPYFVEWARGFNIPYLHVGGSNEAIDLLSKTTVFDLNEFYNGRYFWRDKNRFAPHNVYTSSELVAKAVVAKNWTFKNDFATWKFLSEDEEKSLGLGDTSVVEVDFSSANYNVVWSFDSGKKEYVRQQNGRVFFDAEGSEIRVKNLVIIYTSSRVIDDEGRRKTKTIGSGDAEIHYLGQKFSAVWQKDALSSRMKLYDSSGQEFKFPAGKFWLEIVPDHYTPATTRTISTESNL